jgi:hypothetical protein
MFVDSKDERLTLWKPGHNITYCADENKMIDTTINSVATLLSEFAAMSCKPRLVSDAIDRSLKRAWDYANTPSGDPTAFVTEANYNLDGITKSAPITQTPASRVRTLRISFIPQRP